VPAALAGGFELGEGSKEWDKKKKILSKPVCLPQTFIVKI